MLAAVLVSAVGVLMCWSVAVEPRPEDSVSATVTVDGVRLSIDGIEVSGPAGVAPPGTGLTATRDPAPPDGQVVVGGGISLALDSGRPWAPLTVSFPVPDPPAGAVAVVLASDARLLPATVAAGRMTVVVDRLDGFWPAFQPGG